MSIIYVASIGQTAATKRYYWNDARERFRYTESVLICSKQLVEPVSRFLDKNANLIIVDSPFYGGDGYVSVVKAIVKQVMSIVKNHEKKGKWIDEIVVNTAGGTEKMSCIIKDAVDVLRRLFPYVTHVWGATNGYETTYTVKPKIDLDELCAPFEPERASPKAPEPKAPPIIEVPKPVVLEPAAPVPCATALEKKSPKPPHKKAEKDEHVIAAREKALAERKRQKEAKRQAREEMRQRRHKAHLHELARKKKGIVGAFFDAVEDWLDDKVDDASE